MEEWLGGRKVINDCPTFPFCNHIPAPPPVLPGFRLPRWTAWRERARSFTKHTHRTRSAHLHARHCSQVDLFRVWPAQRMSTSRQPPSRCNVQRHAARPLQHGCASSTQPRGLAASSASSSVSAARRRSRTGEAASGGRPRSASAPPTHRRQAIVHVFSLRQVPAMKNNTAGARPADNRTKHVL